MQTKLFRFSELNVKAQKRILNGIMNMWLEAYSEISGEGIKFGEIPAGDKGKSIDFGKLDGGDSGNGMPFGSQLGSDSPEQHFTGKEIPPTDGSGADVFKGKELGSPEGKGIKFGSRKRRAFKNNYGFQAGQKMWWLNFNDDVLPVTVEKVLEGDKFIITDENLREMVEYGWDLYETEQQAIDAADEQTGAMVEAMRALKNYGLVDSIGYEMKNVHQASKKTAKKEPPEGSSFLKFGDYFLWIEDIPEDEQTEREKEILSMTIYDYIRKSMKRRLSSEEKEVLIDRYGSKKTADNHPLLPEYIDITPKLLEKLKRRGENPFDVQLDQVKPGEYNVNDYISKDHKYHIDVADGSNVVWSVVDNKEYANDDKLIGFLRDLGVYGRASESSKKVARNWKLKIDLSNFLSGGDDNVTNADFVGKVVLPTQKKLLEVAKGDLSKFEDPQYVRSELKNIADKFSMSDNIEDYDNALSMLYDLGDEVGFWVESSRKTAKLGFKKITEARKQARSIAEKFLYTAAGKMVKNTKKIAGKYTADNLIVNIINWDKINAEITKTAKASPHAKPDWKEKGARFEAREWGWIKDPTQMLITDESVALISEPYTVDFYYENGNSFGAMPSFSVDFDASDFEKYLTGETKTLKEFMGSRFGYNSRIQSNTSGVLSHVNGVTASKRVAKTGDPTTDGVIDKLDESTNRDLDNAEEYNKLSKKPICPAAQEKLKDLSKEEGKVAIDAQDAAALLESPECKIGSFSRVRNASKKTAIAMKPFTEGDWQGFAGAEEVEGKPALIGELLVADWPKEDALGEGGGVVAVVDINGMQLMGMNYWLNFNSTYDRALVVSKLLVDGITVKELMDLGFENSGLSMFINKNAAKDTKEEKKEKTPTDLAVDYIVKALQPKEAGGLGMSFKDAQAEAYKKFGKDVKKEVIEKMDPAKKKEEKKANIDILETSYKGASSNVKTLADLKKKAQRERLMKVLNGSNVPVKEQPVAENAAVQVTAAKERLVRSQLLETQNKLEQTKKAHKLARLMVAKGMVDDSTEEEMFNRLVTCSKDKFEAVELVVNAFKPVQRGSGSLRDSRIAAIRNKIQASNGQLSALPGETRDDDGSGVDGMLSEMFQ